MKLSAATKKHVTSSLPPANFLHVESGGSV